MTQAIHLGIPQFQTFLLVLFRVGAILAALPLMGARTVPHLVKLGVAVALSLIVTPFVTPLRMPDDPGTIGLGLLAESCIGLVIGLAVRSVFAGIEVAGEVMGSQMGFGVAQLFDPMSAHQVPLMAQFQSTLAMLVFLSLNLHLLVVHAVGESFRLIPPFGATLTEPVMEDMLGVVRGMFLVALQLAAPVVIVTLMVNLSMALMGRAVPNLNIFVLSFPLTIMFGLVAIGLALPTLVGLYASEFEALGRTLDSLLRGLGHE